MREATRRKSKLSKIIHAMCKEKVDGPMYFLNKNFDRVSPKPFIVWFIVGLMFLGVSFFGVSIEFVLANATYINITYGLVVSNFITLVICVLLPLSRIGDNFFYKAYELSRLFSDTAMGAAGFVAVSGLYNGAYEAVGWLILGVIIYTLVGNNVYYSVFNENKGIRRFFIGVDVESNTLIGDGEINRGIENIVLSFAALVVLMVFTWLLWILSKFHA